MLDVKRTMLEAELTSMADQDVIRALNEAEAGSEAADIIAGEIERRGIDT